MNHDIEDALRAGVIIEEDIPLEIVYESPHAMVVESRANKISAAYRYDNRPC